MKILGLKWKDLREETKEFLLEEAIAYDENCNEVEEGDCIIDLTNTISVSGKIVDREIVIDNDAVIYDSREGVKPLSYSERAHFKDNNSIYEIMTISEAAEKWGKVEGTIRAAIKRKEFIEGVDFRKAGRITLITKGAMERVYGEPKED